MDARRRKAAEWVLKRTSSRCYRGYGLPGLNPDALLFTRDLGDRGRVAISTTAGVGGAGREGVRVEVVWATGSHTSRGAMRAELGLGPAVDGRAGVAR